MPLNDAMRERLEGWKEVAMALAPLLLGEELAETPDVLRARYNRELARNLPPADVSVSHVDMGGIPGALVTPAEPREERAMLYIHGGGYFSGGSAGYQGIAGHFAKLLGASVYVPDYRLAPENFFPAPLDDVAKAYAWLAANLERADRIVLAGDSAGGAMVVSTMVRARNAGLPLPAAGVAISPWANLEMTGASYTTRDGVDPLCSREILALMARAILGTTRPNDPEVSPVFADVRGLPPILVQIGESEVMLSDAIRLATHLADSRVQTSLEVWPDMFHVWPMFADVFPEAREALESAVSFLDRRLGRTRSN